MPIPKPKAGESKDDFIERCMSNETMLKEYEDNDQRYAICNSQWKKRGADMSKIETRTAEIRLAKRDEGVVIEGYPAVFNKLSEDLGGFREKVAPGAFKKTLKEKADVRALWNHDRNYVLGRTASGTLALKEDNKGLRMENRPPQAVWAQDLIASIERGDVNQMSFGFVVVSEEWAEKPKGTFTRTLNEVDLIDVSVVTYPAYPDTQVALRSLEQHRNQFPPGAISDGEPDEPVAINEAKILDDEAKGLPTRTFFRRFSAT